MYRNFLTKRFQLKSRLSMAFQPSADSFGIRRLGGEGLSINIYGLSVVGGIQGKQMTL